MKKLPKSVRRRLAAKAEISARRAETAPVIVQTVDGWAVHSPHGAALAGPFATNSEAWRALDRLDTQHLAMEDANRRIRTAFSE